MLSVQEIAILLTLIVTIVGWFVTFYMQVRLHRVIRITEREREERNRLYRNAEELERIINIHGDIISYTKMAVFSIQRNDAQDTNIYADMVTEKTKEFVMEIEIGRDICQIIDGKDVLETILDELLNMGEKLGNEFGENRYEDVLETCNDMGKLRRDFKERLNIIIGKALHRLNPQ